jgi:Na+/H+ antiporter
VEANSVALLVLGLAIVTLVGTALARRTGLPDPVVLVATGVAASFLPHAPVLELPPDLVFLVFLPPLVFRASFLTTPDTLRRNATPLALLSVGLVLATAVLVAVVASLVIPGIDFARGLVLGAVVAPTDPVAATNVFQRLGAPRRVVDLVQGESLINDATALVLYAVALEAVLSGAPSLGGAALRLVASVAGGVGVGLAVGTAVVLVRNRINDVGLQLLLTLVTPYLAYLPADRIGTSGVLAVVVTGVLLGARPEGRFGAAARLQSTAFWSLLDLALNAALFVLLGLEVRQIVQDAPDLSTAALIGYGALVVVVVVAARVLWQFVVPPLVYRLRSLAGRPEARSSAAERLLVGWTGMRGAISLAAALALPLEVRGEPFAARPLLLFLTVVVVLVTLVVQGLSLPLLLARTGLADDSTHVEQERELRLELAETALARLDDLEESGKIPPGSAGPLREIWQQARAKVSENGREAEEAPAVDLVALRLDIARVQGELLSERRRAGLHPDVARELQHELDLQQVRLSKGPAGHTG